MSWFIFRLTLRQILARRGFLVTLVLAALPIAIALIYRISDPETDPVRWTSRLMENLLVTGVLPLTALLLGVSVLGDEIEDSTAVYLLAKPIPRWQILLPKLVAASLVSIAIVLPSTIVSGMIALQGEENTTVVRGFAIAVTLGCVAYTSVFVLTSLLTSRAIITGLAYIFVWETTVTGLFEGTRYFSIRQHVLGIADWFSDTAPAVFDAYVSGMLALILIAVVTFIAVVLAEIRLEETEVREAV